MMDTNIARHFLIVFCSFLLISLAASNVSAQATPRCFPETGQCIGKDFLAFWESNRGLQFFGFPITNVSNEFNPDAGKAFPTQWFERNRFELHLENKPPDTVLIGRLGDARLLQCGRNWKTFPKANPRSLRYFHETGHSIAFRPFWDFWRRHGLDLGDPGVSRRESVALFGYPISEKASEMNNNGQMIDVQWFERARFEWHPRQPAPHKVQLGLLGAEMQAEQDDGGRKKAPC